MPPGRPPAPTDAAAIAARAEVEKFMGRHDLKPSQLGKLAGVTPATAARVLAKGTPVWTDGFTKIVNFVNSQKGEEGALMSLTTSLRGDREAAHAAAALLRAVANLLEKA